MKILLVLEATLGGTARYILDLSRGLVEAGHEVHLAFSRKRADQAFEGGLKELQASNLPFFTHEMSAQRGVTLSDTAVLVNCSATFERTGRLT